MYTTVPKFKLESTTEKFQVFWIGQFQTSNYWIQVKIGTLQQYIEEIKTEQFQIDLLKSFKTAAICIFMSPNFQTN